MCGAPQTDIYNFLKNLTTEWWIQIHIFLDIAYERYQKKSLHTVCSLICLVFFFHSFLEAL